MTKPLVLALDLATTSGWALGRVGERCSHGSIRFCKRSKCSRAEILYEAGSWLVAFIKQHQPEIIIFESPIIIFGGLSNLSTQQLLQRICGVVEYESIKHGIYKVSDVSVHTVRKFVLGFKPKKNEAKKEIIKQVTAWGYTPKDDNAADAIAIFIYFTKTYQKQIENGEINVK